MRVSAGMASSSSNRMVKGFRTAPLMVELVSAGIELRHREMIANIEEVVRRQQAIEKLERRLEIHGLIFADDEAGDGTSGLVLNHSL